MWPAIIAGATALGSIGGSVYSAKSSAKEAEKNRNFQERMSNTAHQREVADLVAAGLNPALSAMRGSGASTPSGSMPDVPDYGEAVGRGIHSALAIKQAKANISLTEANAAKVLSEKEFLEESFQLRMREQGSRTDLGELSAQQLRDSMPFLIQKARQEVDSMKSSARAARAAALLDEYAATGAFNESEFQRTIGTKGPWVRLFLDAAGKLGVGALGAGLLVRGGGSGNKWSKGDTNFVKGQRR